jgi:hypothetical protein
MPIELVTSDTPSSVMRDRPARAPPITTTCPALVDCSVVAVRPWPRSTTPSGMVASVNA